MSEEPTTEEELIELARDSFPVDQWEVIEWCDSTEGKREFYVISRAFLVFAPFSLDSHHAGGWRSNFDEFRQRMTAAILRGGAPFRRGYPQRKN